jgi:hypothetical protein
MNPFELVFVAWIGLAAFTAYRIYRKALRG